MALLRRAPARRTRRAPSWLLVLPVAAVGLLLGADRAAAQPPSSGPDVKVAMIYYIAKFVVWPSASFAGDQSPLTITLLGSDSLGRALERVLEDKTVAGRVLIVRRAARLEDVGPSHILVVGVSERDRLAAVLRGVEGRPLLTIADFDGFAGRGGMLGFFVEDNRVRFEINPARLERAGLKVNAKVLALARLVRDRG